MTTHISRKDLKQDIVAQTVGHQIDWFAHHKQTVIRSAAAVVVLIVVVVGVVSYRGSQVSARQKALGEALTVQLAPVGATPPNGGLSFPTEEARAAAAEKAFAKVFAQYNGDDEAYLAEYYLGGMAADAGKLDDALKKYQDVAAHASAGYASVAKLAIAQLHFAQGKVNEARAVLKDLAEHPTSLVSKEQADVTLARGIMDTQPEEARKLLTPLASKAGSEVAQVATAALSEMQK